ncbi:YihY/virulence factor BrkB family protein [Rhabdothermincola salaria]|uniref:YihY/virulence factor BrkB family protein n=1 Tax=Rhabdothermincola salaria TaxID=2903142 RepID=UPI001E2A416F|nr:YihY/virulence factor BrkB family protein [Rhabdothermincola salaria]
MIGQAWHRAADRARRAQHRARGVQDRARRSAPRTWAFGQELAREWREDRVGGLAAEVAFFGMLSLFPALLALTSVLGVLDAVTGGDVADRAQQQVVTALSDVLSDQASGTVDAVDALFETSSPGVLTISVVLALWAASRGFAALVRALDIAYDLPEHRSWVRLRLVAVGLALGSVVIGAALLAMLVIGPLLGTGQAVADWLGLGDGFATFWDWVRWPTMVVLVVAWAATVFHIAPNHSTPWRWDVPGALVAAASWILVSVGFRVYLGLAGEANQVFGLLGGGLIALMWFYLLSVGVLLGGEVNAILAVRRLTDGEAPAEVAAAADAEDPA